MVLGLAALGLVFFGWLARISPLLTALGAVLYSGTLWVAVGKPKSVTAFAQSMRASTFAASLGDEWQAIVVMSAGLRARWQALEEEWARRREEVRKRLEEQAEKDAKAARDAAAAAQELRDPAADAEACAQVLSLYESHCRYLKRLFKPKELEDAVAAGATPKALVKLWQERVFNAPGVVIGWHDYHGNAISQAKILEEVRDKHI